MLGIGQISTRIAELIRGALPYAIVNNDPDSSAFARLISYSEVQQALDAGHKWIQVKESDVSYKHFAISNSNTTVVGSYGALIDGGTTDAAITINHGADYCRIEGFRVQTDPAGGNDYHGVDIYGDYNTVAFCTVVDTDQDGIACAQTNSGAWNRFIGCTVIDCSRYAYAGWGEAMIVVGCLSLAQNSYAAGSGDNVFVGNFFKGGTVEHASSGNMIIGNIVDASIVATSGNANFGTGSGTAPGSNQVT